MAAARRRWSWLLQYQEGAVDFARARSPAIAAAGGEHPRPDPVERRDQLDQFVQGPGRRLGDERGQPVRQRRDPGEMQKRTNWGDLFDRRRTQPPGPPVDQVGQHGQENLEDLDPRRAVVAAGGVLGYQYWKSTQSALPPGIAVRQRPYRGEARGRVRQGAAQSQGNPGGRGRSRQAGSGAGAARHGDARSGAGEGQRRRFGRQGATGGRQLGHRQAAERDPAGADRDRALAQAGRRKRDVRARVRRLVAPRSKRRAPAWRKSRHARNPPSNRSRWRRPTWQRSRLESTMRR